MKPVTGIELFESADGFAPDLPAAIGGPLQSGVMNYYRFTIFAAMDVQLDDSGSISESLFKRWKSIFRSFSTGAPVTDDPRSLVVKKRVCAQGLVKT